MFGELFLTAALVAGQPPTPAPTLPASPTIPVPDVPLVPVPNPSGGVGLSPDLYDPTEPGSPGGPPTGLLMRALDGTRLGDFLGRTNTTVSGFTDLRYTASNVNLNRLPTLMGFSYDQDLPQFNWLRIDRPVDPTASEPTFGYRFDTILFGSTYHYTLPRGLFNGQLTDRNGQPNRYGVDPVQHYLHGYFPNVFRGMDVKVGRTFFHYGVESLDPTQTILPSWSYTFTYNPFTNTGLFTETKLTDRITIENDFFTGDDVWIDRAATFNWLGGIRWLSDGGGTDIRLAVLLSEGRYDTRHNLHNVSLVDFDVIQKLGDDLTYTFEFLYGWEDDVPGIGFANWYGFVNYLTYAWTEKLSTTGRVEFFDDRQGQRTGFAGLYNSFTVGSTWRPVDWFMIRPELRYDYHADARPFDGKREFFGAMINAIVLW